MATPNELVMTGAGSSVVNTTYTRGEDVSGMPAWYSDNSLSLQLWDTWVIKNISTGVIYYRSEGYESPTWVTVSGIGNGPLITEGEE